MSTKITGFDNWPVQVGGDKAVGRGRDAAAAPAGNAAAGGPVHITDQARRLAALEQAVQAAPVVDESRVTAIRQALADGSYQVSPERIADKLMRMDRDLSATEK